MTSADISRLARPEILALRPYASARSQASANGILLNANENPYSPVEMTAKCNRYPLPQPPQLVQAFAQRYQVAEDQLMLSRGSDEAIDCLTRVFCRAGQDAILHTPPCFGMYAIAAKIQGAAIVEAPLLEQDGFEYHVAQLMQSFNQATLPVKLIFLASPQNPTGQTLKPDQLQQLLDELGGRAILVLDEAYIEFCGHRSASALINQHPNLVVLRTLSKAYGLAGVRLGITLTQAPMIELLKRVIAPYPLAQPALECVAKSLSAEAMTNYQDYLSRLQNNKRRLLDLLAAQSWLETLWPGEANFVLLRTSQAAPLLEHCQQHSVLLRDMSAMPGLQQCIRISIGSEQELAVLAEVFNSFKPISRESESA